MVDLVSGLVAEDGSPLFDLQSHSVWSDGSLPAAEVVERAAAAGVEVLSLTDHDAIDGTAEALDAGAAFGVRVIPAVEISSIDPEGDDLHILGYDVDWKQPELLAALKDFRADREGRADRMAQALNESQADAHGRIGLSARDRIHAAANDLRHVGAAEKT